jgi:hypothetical protein
MHREKAKDKKEVEGKKTEGGTEGSKAHHRHCLRLHLPALDKFFLFLAFFCSYITLCGNYLRTEQHTCINNSRMCAVLPSGVQPNPAEMDPAKKNRKKAEVGLGLGPSRPNLFWAKGLFGKTHPYANLLYFFSHLFWYLAKRALCNIIKFQKKLF